MITRVPMTTQGYQKLQQELKRLKTKERPKVTRAIENARAHGDITENVEYDAAKEAQAFLTQRIKQIEDKLARAQIIRPEVHKSDRVVFGSTVILTNLTQNRQLTYKLVGQDEADISKQKLSITSPLARAMISKQAGEHFIFQSPTGEREYKVNKIMR